MWWAYLIEIAAKAPHATICLRSALARQDLIDDIPGEIDIAIPRGSWTPETTVPVRWRRFDPGTFEIGRDQLVSSGGDADQPRRGHAYLGHAPTSSVTGKHSASRSTTSRQARCACRGW